MPIYTYNCENCGHQFDRQQSFSDESLRACPQCKKHTLHKVYRPSGVVFKGSGFYVTDKKSAKLSSASSIKAKENGASETKGETKKETKPEAKANTDKPSTKER